MKNRIFIALFLISLSFSAFSQKNITWQDLSYVNFEEQYLDNFGDSFLIPAFENQVLKLNGKTIFIKGYVLDLVEDKYTFLLSKNPMASCFFCGMAGPETIVEVQFKEETKLKTDQIITVKGTLQLNKDDVNHCNYILKNATII